MYNTTHDQKISIWTPFGMSFNCIMYEYINLLQTPFELIKTTAHSELYLDSRNINIS